MVSRFKQINMQHYCKYKLHFFICNIDAYFLLWFPICFTTAPRCKFAQLAGAPLGTGILYMKKEKIEKVWPLYEDGRYEDDDMRKFGHIGTIPCHNDLAIEDAIRFHQMIGGQRKEERLRYLSTYWMEKLQSHPNIQINSPSQSNRFCAIGNVRIKNMESKELVDVLFEQYGIFTTTKLDGIRVTPHLYNSREDLDKFVLAM